MKNAIDAWKGLWKALIPVVYLIIWYFLPVKILGLDNIDITALTWTALPVLFIGVISNTVSWSMGGDNGIKGDNIGAQTKVTLDRRGSYEIRGASLNKEQIQAVVDSVKENTPLVKSP